MSSSHLCLAGCGKRITNRFAICSGCEKIYGSKVADWPEWLRFLWHDEQRVRAQDNRIQKYEITEADLDDDE